MSYSLLEMQETLRNIPIDGVKRVASGQHGKAHQLLAMDELKRRQEMSANAQAESAEAGVQAPPMIDQYMKLAGDVSQLPIQQQMPGQGQIPQAPARGLPPQMPPQMPMTTEGYSNGGIVDLFEGMGPPSTITSAAIPNQGGARPSVNEILKEYKSHLYPTRKEEIIKQLLATGMSPEMAEIEAVRVLENESTRHFISAQPKNRSLMEILGVHPGGADKARELRDQENVINLNRQNLEDSPGAFSRLISDVPGQFVRGVSSGASSFSDALKSPRQRAIDNYNERLARQTKESPQTPNSNGLIEVNRTVQAAAGNGNSGTPNSRGSEDDNQDRNVTTQDSSDIFNSPWAALMQAGLNIAAGDSPDAISNIAGGAGDAFKQYQGRLVQERELEDRRDRDRFQNKLVDAQVAQLEAETGMINQYSGLDLQKIISETQASPAYQIAKPEEQKELLLNAIEAAKAAAARYSLPGIGPIKIDSSDLKRQVSGRK